MYIIWFRHGLASDGKFPNMTSLHEFLFIGFTVFFKLSVYVFRIIGFNELVTKVNVYQLFSMKSYMLGSYPNGWSVSHNCDRIAYPERRAIRQTNHGRHLKKIKGIKYKERWKLQI